MNGKIETIDDITEYNRANCITPEWVLSKVENPVRKECKKLGIPYSAELEQSLNRIGNDLFSIPVDDSGEHTLIQWANYLMQGWFAGTDNGRDEPAWFQQGTQRLKDGRMLDAAENVLAADLAKLPNSTAESIRKLIYSDDVPKVLNRDGSKKLNDTLVYCLEQFRVDPNDPDDRDFHIETRVCNGVRSDGKPAPEQPKTDNDIVKFLNKVM